MLKHRGMFDAMRCYLCSAGTFAAWWYLNVNVNAPRELTIRHLHFHISRIDVWNWSQHIFVCPDDPQNEYKSVYTCINSFENQKTFDDGYHATPLGQKGSMATYFSQKETLRSMLRKTRWCLTGCIFLTSACALCWADWSI